MFQAHEAERARSKASKVDARKPKPKSEDYQQLEVELPGRSLPSDLDKLIAIAATIVSTLHNIERSIDVNTDAVQRNLEAMAKLERTVSHAWGDADDTEQA